jgi:hypothetical protein
VAAGRERKPIFALPKHMDVTKNTVACLQNKLCVVFVDPPAH